MSTASPGSVPGARKVANRYSLSVGLGVFLAGAISPVEMLLEPGGGVISGRYYLSFQILIFWIAGLIFLFPAAIADFYQSRLLQPVLGLLLVLASVPAFTWMVQIVCRIQGIEWDVD